MSPKSLFFFVVVGLCAAQMVSAHREARGIAEFFNTARNKLANVLTAGEDATLSSINTVKEYINGLENKLLESGTNALNKAGIDIDLNDLAALVKGNVRVCAQDEEVKEGATEILNNMATCVTKDVSKLKALIGEMEDLWETAQSMPDAIRDVVDRCRSDDAVAEEPLDLTVTLDTSDHELAEASNKLLQDASKHLSKRALWDLNRYTRCVKTVFNFAKKDLVSIPGDIITAATHAYQVVHSVQGGIPSCVAQKAVENGPQIAKLALKVGSCVAAEIANGDETDSQSLAALKQLTVVAEKLNDLSNSGALNTASDLAQVLG